MSANASRVAGDHVPELVGGELPVRLRLADVLGQRDRAAQALVDAGAAGQQRVAAGGPSRVPLPDDLAARRAQAEHERDRPAHHRPHRRGELLVAGDQQLVPDADRRVGDLVALRGGVGDHAAGGAASARSRRRAGCAASHW